MDARQHILDSIRAALKQPSHLPAEAATDDLSAQVTDAAPKTLEEKIVRFTSELTAVSGECEQVSSIEQAAEKIVEIARTASPATVAVAGGAWVERAAEVLRQRGIDVVAPADLPEPGRKTAVAEVKVGLVEAAFAVADSGTIAVPFVAGRSTLPHFLTEVVIALAPITTLVADHFELFQNLPPNERKNLLLVTGPSRTADIEKILILGAHGPRRLVVLLIEE